MVHVRFHFFAAFVQGQQVLVVDNGKTHLVHRDAFYMFFSKARIRQRTKRTKRTERTERTKRDAETFD